MPERWSMATRVDSMPELGRLIVADGGNQLPIGTECHRRNRKFVRQYAAQMVQLVLPASHVHPNLPFEIFRGPRHNLQSVRQPKNPASGVPLFAEEETSFHGQ